MQHLKVALLHNLSQASGNKQKNLLPLSDKVKTGNTKDQAANKKNVQDQFDWENNQKFLEEIPLLLENASVLKFLEEK